MIVIHPKDPSTWMLKLIYKDIPNIHVFDSWLQRKDIISSIISAPIDEVILLLGHGSSAGLLDKRFGLIINDEDACIFENRPNLVGIWCYASDYAYNHKLRGFFSGMFISEMTESLQYGVRTSKKEVDNKTIDFASRFGRMLHGGCSIGDIALAMTEKKHQDCELTLFNYSRFSWRPTGSEDLPLGYHPK